MDRDRGLGWLLAVSLMLGLSLISAAQADDLGATGDAVISRSEGGVLHARDFAEQFELFPLQDLQRIASSDAALLDMVMDVHADSMLATQALALKLDEDPEIAAALAAARRQVLVKGLILQTRKDVVLPDDDVLKQLAEQRYAGKTDDFWVQERRQISHILLKDQADCACEASSPALERASALRGRALAGEDFAALAESYSKDERSAVRGGSIGWTERGAGLAQAFEDAAFALENVGDISEPVETDFGVHVIKLTAVEPRYRRPFDEVQAGLIAKIKQEIYQSAVEKVRAAAYPDPATVDLGALRELIGQIER